jgi:sortase A
MGNSRRAGLVLRFLEVSLLVIGCAALAWYTTVRISAVREQASLSQELIRLSSREPKRASTGAGASTDPRATASPLWRIEVPRLSLSAVAREGVDTRTLRRAVGHIPGTAWPGERGNAAFAAHRDTFFRPLKGVLRGDEVIVTTAEGVYRYAVTGTRVVDPTDVSVLDPTSGTTLTLVTCYPFDYVGSAPQRFIVRASLQR